MNNIRLVEVTITVKAVMAVSKYSNIYQLAEKCKPEILQELESNASIDIDDFYPENWDDDFIPYGDNKNEMPISSFLMFNQE